MLAEGRGTGIDGQTPTAYAGNGVEDRLADLVARAKSGRYRAPPVRRAYIPKGDGGQRPIGIPTLEDKLLQRAVVLILEPIMETEFSDFSYGFRLGRSARTGASCSSSAATRQSGKGLQRLAPPLLSMISSIRFPKSTCCTRRCMASIRRRPEPYRQERCDQTRGLIRHGG